MKTTPSGKWKGISRLSREKKNCYKMLTHEIEKKKKKKNHTHANIRGLRKN